MQNHQRLPLTSPQMSIWLDQALHPDQPTYNIGGYTLIEEPIQIDVFKKALQTAVNGTEGIRYHFSTTEGQPVQTLGTCPEVALPVIAFDGNESEAIKWMQTRFLVSFDIETAPLFEYALLKIHDSRYLWFQKYHHLIADGHTVATLSLITSRLYTAYCAGFQPDVPELIPYREYIAQDQAYLSSEQYQLDEAYWAHRLPEMPKPSITRSRSKVGASQPPVRLESEIPAEVWQRLHRFAKQNGSSGFKVMLAALYVYCTKTTDEVDHSFGVALANRSRRNFKCMGMFSKAMPFRISSSRDLRLNELITTINQSFAEDLKHQRFPPEHIGRRLNILGTQQSQLYDITLNYMKFRDEIRFNECASVYHGLSHALTSDLSIISVQGGGSRDMLKLYYDYDPRAFSAEEIYLFRDRFEYILTILPDYQDQLIGDIPVIPRAERKRLAHWNDTAESFPASCFHELFEARVQQSPESIALQATASDHRHEILDYASLNAKANRLAHFLIASGVGPGVQVGVALDRSPHLVAALLAVMKAGGTYVPLDPDYPRDRIRYMLDDADCSVLLSLSYLGFDDERVINLDQVQDELEGFSFLNPANEHRLAPLSNEHAAYIIYTSGSTGKPKGVVISHRSLVNFLTSICRRPGLDCQDGMLAITTICFDIAALELYLPLLCGARVVLATREDALDGFRLQELLERENITAMQATPATWQILRRSGWTGNARLNAFSGGEALSPDLADWLVQRTGSLWNLYGPTETTIWSTVSRLDAGEPVTIGRPIANTRVYVLDKELNPLPIGVPGELFIGGEGVAIGYHNRSELTRERFINNPLDPLGETRLYRTGDLVRWLPDGNLDCLGRLDHQVKIRGYRIETGEIEAELAAHDGVQSCVVAAIGEREEKKLIAWYVPSGKKIDHTALRNRLTKSLPVYMIPSTFISLEQMPTTPNGKLDRARLPLPEQSVRTETHIEARTPLEAQLCRLWAKVLGRDMVGVHDNFFDLGGHSLQAVSLSFDISEALNRTVPVGMLMTHPTVAALALALEDEEPAQAIDFNRDALLPENIQPHQHAFDIDQEARSILLTGATGYLGAYLLYELLQQTRADIYCLARAASSHIAYQRIRANLETYGLWDDGFTARIHAVRGDLSKPLLGLDSYRFYFLAARIDRIYHNGALVNFIYPYSQLKQANVDGTREIIRLACRAKTTPIHFISTFSVFPSPKERQVVPETQPPEHCEILETGYSQSKWVAEKMLTEARKRGVPVTIYRPGRITGHSRTGMANKDDLFYRFIKGCIQSGSVPDWPGRIDTTPVDYVSQAIIAISCHHEVREEIYHLVNPDPISANELFGWFASQGYSLERQPYPAWEERVLRETPPDNALHPLLPFFRNWQPPYSEGPETLFFDCSNVIRALQGTEIRCPKTDHKVWMSCLQHLVDTGFLPDLHKQAA